MLDSNSLPCRLFDSLVDNTETTAWMDSHQYQVTGQWHHESQIDMTYDQAPPGPGNALQDFRRPLCLSVVQHTLLVELAGTA